MEFKLIPDRCPAFKESDVLTAAPLDRSFNQLGQTFEVYTCSLSAPCSPKPFTTVTFAD